MRIGSSAWITVTQDTGDVCPVFRRRFTAGKKMVEAELEITSLGVYEACLNGRRVSDFVLAPGWTSYDHRLQVQTYDVTPLLRTENELRVTVGRGWFRSPIPGWMDFPDKKRRYGQPCGLIASLRIRYADGTEKTVQTDEAWQWAESPVRFSEIYDGERVDARVVPGDWQPVRRLDWTRDILIPQEGEAIRETERRRTLQQAYNEAHGIVPKTIIKSVRELIEISRTVDVEKDGRKLTRNEREAEISRLEKEMKKAAKMMEFEYAAILRDQIIQLRGIK